MFEISHAQTVFYGFDKSGIGQALILCGSVLIPRLIDEAELQKAANEVFRINDGLRSYFIEKDEKVYQDLKPFEEQTFEVMRFESKEELDAWGNMYATIPLKLDIRSEGSGVSKDRWKTGKTSPVLIKNVLLHNAKTSIKRIKNKVKVTPSCCDMKLVYLPDSCGAIVKMHHLVSDAWTMMLVANQFVRLLNGEEPKAYQYEEWLESEAAYQGSKRYQRDGAYFKQQYERCPEPTLVWPNPMNTLEAKRTTITLDRDETSQIIDYAAAHNVSPYIVFLTALCVFISRKLNRKQFYVGSVVINRVGIRELNTAGMFINSVPLLAELSDDATFAELAAYLRDENFAAIRHEKGPRVNSATDLLYDLWVSYQTATLDADETAICTQYYCNYAPTLKVFTIEDRSMEGRFKIHFDHTVEVTDAETDEMFRVMLAVLRDGIVNDSKKLTELGL